MEITLTHFAASWIIPTFIFAVIFVILWLFAYNAFEINALPFMLLQVVNVAWYVIYMIIWFVRHFNELGLIHIKVV